MTEKKEKKNNNMSRVEAKKKEEAINKNAEKKDNAIKSEYAMLEDRVNVNLNKKQRFGSQVTYNKLGQAIPVNGLIDSINIENIRQEFELPPFKQYYNEMTQMHFEMNRDLFIKKGITEPKLYK